MLDYNTLYTLRLSVCSSRSEPRLALVGADAQHGASGRHHGYAAVRLSRGEFCNFLTGPNRAWALFNHINKLEFSMLL